MNLFKTEATRCANLAGVNNPTNDEIYAAQDGCCFGCQRRIGFYSATDREPGGYTVEHVFPSALGFGLFSNKVLSCLDCNRKKARALPDMTYLGAVRDMYKRIFPQQAIDALRSAKHPVWVGRSVGASRIAHCA